jgi:hypothetical protein
MRQAFPYSLSEMYAVGFSHKAPTSRGIKEDAATPETLPAEMSRPVLKM